MFGGPILLAPSNPAQIVGPASGAVGGLSGCMSTRPSVLQKKKKKEEDDSLVSSPEIKTEGGGKKQLLYFQVISPSLTSQLVRFSAAPLKRFSAFLCYS